MEVFRSIWSSSLLLLLVVQLSAAQELKIVERPASVVKQMATRGQQDAARPTIKIISPKPNEVIKGTDVPLLLALSGDLKGYHPHKDATTGTGNHIHVILDNNAYEAYYDIKTPMTIPNLKPGEHTLRVFASRPWHESYKNPQAFAMVKFSVVNSAALSAQRVTVKSDNPLLTYSRPKGEYRGADAEAIMIDFWLTNAKLKGQGGKYIVRCTVDGQTLIFDKWEPIWLSGWTAGKHKIQLELLNDKSQILDNGGYNMVSREFTVVK